MRKVYNRQSLWSKILNQSFMFTSCKKRSSSEEAAKEFIEKTKNKYFGLRPMKNFNKENIANHDVFFYNGTFNNSKNRVMLYVHGGNFVERANMFQISFAKKIAIATNSTLIVPFYDLLPMGNFKKMNELLKAVYEKILLLNPKEIIFVGDSAGGGAILSFAMQIRNEYSLQPSNIILLSPWLDLSMSNPELYNDEKNDKMNGVDGSRYEGKLWALNEDVYSPIISPMYGTFENLGKITLVFGGKEILSSECNRFDKILTDMNVEHNYLLYKKEGHDFAAYPTKEGRMAIKEIISIINS